MHWLLHFLGLDSASGPAYLAWSGAGGDLGELAIAGALIAVIRRHNCHAARCWRIGRHKVPGTDFICCARHTPGGAPTHAHILALHAARPAAPGSAEAGERLYDQEKDTP